MAITNVVYQNTQLLPPRAKQWLQRYLSTDAHRAAHPAVQAVAQQIAQLRAKTIAMLGDDEPSVAYFRKVHTHAFSTESVGVLPIDDGLFLDLLWNDVFTIEDLRRLLADDSAVAFITTNENAPDQEGLTDALTRAIQDWENPVKDLLH